MAPYTAAASTDAAGDDAAVGEGVASSVGDGDGPGPQATSTSDRRLPRRRRGDAIGMGGPSYRPNRSRSAARAWGWPDALAFLNRFGVWAATTPS
jgi:hypothetical protein